MDERAIVRTPAVTRTKDEERGKEEKITGPRDLG